MSEHRFCHTDAAYVLGMIDAWQDMAAVTDADLAADVETITGRQHNTATEWHDMAEAYVDGAYAAIEYYETAHAAVGDLAPSGEHGQGYWQALFDAAYASGGRS